MTYPGAVFILLLLLYFAHALLTANADEHQRAERRGAILIQTPVFVMAVYLAYRQDVFGRHLLSPLYIAGGLFAGHLIFGLSLLITLRSLSDSASHFFNCAALWAFLVENPFVISWFLSVSVAEELIWRAAAQPVLIHLAAVLNLTDNPAVSIGVVAALFAVVHRHFFRNEFMVSAEFLAFSILLGFLYYWTESLILVVVIHALRDIEIAYLEYVIKVHELGDEDKAAAALQRQYQRRLMRTT